MTVLKWLQANYLNYLLSSIFILTITNAMKPSLNPLSPMSTEVPIRLGHSVQLAGTASCDDSTDIVGGEWYKDGEYLATTTVSPSRETTVSRTMEFEKAGSYNIELFAFTRNYQYYSNSISWKIIVKPSKLKASGPALILCPRVPAAQTQFTYNCSDSSTTMHFEAEVVDNGKAPKLRWFSNSVIPIAVQEFSSGIPVPNSTHANRYFKVYITVDGQSEVKVSVVAQDSEGLYSEPVNWIIKCIPKQRGLYVDKFSQIVGNEEAERELLEFSQAHEYSSLALYDLNLLLRPSSTKHSAVAKFISRARRYGIKRVIGAVGCLIEHHPTYIRAYNEGNADNPSALFDGFVTECEFWGEENRDEAFDQFLTLLNFLRQHTSRKVPPLSVAVYLGHVSDSELQEIVPKVDEVWIHAYVKKPEFAWKYIKSRIQGIPGAKCVDIVPIFSAETLASGKALGIEGTDFMGDWIQSHTPGLDLAEQILRSDWYDDLDLKSHEAFEKLSGFQYFAYSFVKSAVEGGS